MLTALLATLAPADLPNVLIVLIDDVGVDRIAAYAEHPNPGVTPTIDGLAANGVLFRNAWAAPLCSPSRACLLTGLLPSRTGVGNNVEKTSGHGIEDADVTLPEALGVPSRMVGKWHLNRDDFHDYPRTVGGFEHYRGVLFNLTATGGDYFGWLQTEDGSQHWEPGYVTTTQVDDAIQFVQQMAEPWFLLVSTAAAHAPYHEPPPHLTTQPPPVSDGDRHRLCVEALDTELGRLLATLPEDTYVILMGDNGTGKVATEPPFVADHGKGTLYEGGLNVPLIVSGPGVVPGENDALVSITDVFATVLDLMGSPAPRPRDSVSMARYLFDPPPRSIRPHVVAEVFTPWKHRSAALNLRGYKLLRTIKTNGPTTEELYHLPTDPWEQADLLAAPLDGNAATSYAYLVRVLDSL